MGSNVLTKVVDHRTQTPVGEPKLFRPQNQRGSRKDSRKRKPTIRTYDPLSLQSTGKPISNRPTPLFPFIIGITLTGKCPHHGVDWRNESGPRFTWPTIPTRPAKGSGLHAYVDTPKQEPKPIYPKPWEKERKSKSPPTPPNHYLEGTTKKKTISELSQAKPQTKQNGVMLPS